MAGCMGPEYPALRFQDMYLRRSVNLSLILSYLSSFSLSNLLIMSSGGPSTKHFNVPWRFDMEHRPDVIVSFIRGSTGMVDSWLTKY